MKVMDTLLRGAMCACWVAGIPLSFMFFIMSINADDPTDAKRYCIKSVVCFGVTVLGACAHALLLNIEDDAQNK